LCRGVYTHAGPGFTLGGDGGSGRGDGDLRRHSHAVWRRTPRIRPFGTRVMTTKHAASSMEKNAVRFRIRPYRQGDDEACRELERHASQGPASRSKRSLTSLLFKAQFSHAFEFDAKARQFPRHAVLVCEDATDQSIVGVLMVGIKECTLGAKKVTLGYMFDVRVHERVQRHGIGRRMCMEAEEQCAAAGCDVLYLSVNGNNGRARQLYSKLGYSLASRRAPAMTFLLSQRPVVWGSASGAPHAKKEPTITTLTPEAAAVELVRTYSGRDCALTDAAVDELLRHDAYEASYVARSADGSSSASLHLWNASHLGSFQVERLVVPIAWLDGMGAPLALGTLAVAFAASFCNRLMQKLDAEETVGAAMMGTAAALIAFGVWKVSPFVRFARRVLVKSLDRRAKLRARIFAPACDGEQGKALLRGLVQHASNEAMAKGFELVVTNLDEKDDRRSEFPKAKFFTLLLQKALRPGPGGAGDGTGGREGQTSVSFDPHAFHDPRDIS
jgi:ribosomal protein S18 acetylase RimI-like enzyme